MTDKAPPVLDVQALSVSLPPGGERRWAVRGVSLSVAAGETLCVVGESGSGTSITAMAVMGMVPPGLAVEEGAIGFEGAPLPVGDPAAMQRLRGARMAMIFQEPRATLDPVQRVGRQLEEVLEVHGISDRAERRRRVLDLLSAVKLPEPERVFRAYPHQLSGGQCQRIVIAMALALEPALLIADEPSTALDVTTQAEILALIDELKTARNAAVLFITHDFGVVADIADRIAVMREGEIVETGPRDQILIRPQHPYTRTLIAAVPSARPGAGNGNAAQPVLSAEGVSLTYKIRSGVFDVRTVTAVRDVGLSLERGKTLGVVGESGSGKSTLARCLLRLEEMDSGRVILHGEDISHADGDALRRVRKRMQVVLQDPYTALDPRQQVRDAVAEGPLIHGATRPEAREKATALLSLVGLPPQVIARYPHEFSGGQRQRICIARALAVEPEVLIADEPVSALDVSIQAQILALFEELQERLGFALLFITHDLRVAASICDDIMVMRDGQVVEYRPTAELFDDPRHGYTRALLDASPGRDAAFEEIVARLATGAGA